MNASYGAPRKIWTEAELQALPEDGCRHELVDGELIVSPRNNSSRGDICTRLYAALLAFAETRNLGAVWDFNTSFRMSNSNVRAPDVSFVKSARLSGQESRISTRRFFAGAPDLAVEILSFHHTPEKMDGRLKDYFTSGTCLTWIVDPEARQMQVCHSLDERQSVGTNGFLEGEDLLPGLHYPIASLFKDWDWE
ncbi:MAG TPA: Uma2 family endonuclease [Verrucomicrobiae bacterium]|nr:Uma2 family endonuclease [Verrucomicrobiae bacterium]